MRAAGAGLVSPHSVDALAETLIELIDRADELPQMGRRGREKIASSYAPKVVAKDMVEKYQELLSRRG